MTGPEHYRYAETLLDMASDDEVGSDQERFHQTQAQVHATLALVAATLDRLSLYKQEWREALS